MSQLALAVPRGDGTRLDRPRLLLGESTAVIVVVIALAALPLIKPSGPGNAAPVDGLIALAIGVVALWAAFGERKVHIPFLVSGAMFMVAGTLGAAAGPIPKEGALAVVQDAILLLWCAGIANLCRSQRTIDIALRAWAYSAAGWAAALVFGVITGNSVLSGVTQENGARAALTFGDANVAANYFFISLMLVWASRRPRHPLARWAVYVLLLTALAMTGSNGGLLQLLCGIFVAAVVAVGRRWGAVAAAGGACLLTAALLSSSVLLPPSEIQRWADASSIAFLRDGIGRSGESADDRGTLFAESMDLYQGGGLLGRGPRSTKSVLAAEQAHRVKEAHNDYAAALIERGIFGALSLVALISAILFRAKTVAFRPLSPAFAAAVARPAAILGAVAGILIAGFFYEVMHFRHVWAFLGIVAAIYMWGRE